MVPIDIGLQNVNLKQKTNLGTFRNNQTYLGIIRINSGIFRILSYPNILKTVVHPEP